MAKLSGMRALHVRALHLIPCTSQSPEYHRCDPKTETENKTKQKTKQVGKYLKRLENMLWSRFKYLLEQDSLHTMRFGHKNNIKIGCFSQCSVKQQ